MEKEGDNSFIPYRFLPADIEYTIGRNSDNTIEYNRREISRVHAALRWNGECWEIEDAYSTNGIYVNGRREKFKKLQLGDEIFILGLRILVGINYFAMNNAYNRVRINSPYITLLQSQADITSICSPPVQDDSPNRPFDRPPRKLIKVTPNPIEIEMPPL